MQANTSTQSPPEFYTTSDLLKRYGRKSARTLNNWRKAEVNPLPDPVFSGGSHCEAGYLADHIHAWEKTKFGKTFAQNPNDNSLSPQAS